MSSSELVQLYERFHFHELDVKEKIAARVQIAFALLMIELSVVGYMIRTMDYSSPEKQTFAFYFFIFFVIIFMTVGSYCLSKAFSGHEYKTVATAKNIDEYKKSFELFFIESEEYNKNNPQDKVSMKSVSDEMDDYLSDTFIICATHNKLLNIKRSELVHRGYRMLLFASLPLIAACLIFIAFDLDASSPRKENAISDEKVASELSELNKNLLKIHDISRGITK